MSTEDFSIPAAPPIEQTTGESGQSRFQEHADKFRQKLESSLDIWLANKEQSALAESSASRELTGVLSRYVARPGKRLRPALLYYTYRACGGRSDDRVLPMAMAAELLHTYLLIHDDIMDHADLRRGEAAAHVIYQDLHRSRGWQGNSRHFGESVAILLGDLAQSYALELFASVDLAPEVAAEFRQCFSTMCQEVIFGQYLEMTAVNREDLDEAELLRVLQMKSGRYSVERPVQLGALLARAPEAVCLSLSRYGSLMGEAFQLQDDLLGMFGDAETVGKPVGGDLIEGKFTVLIHHALANLGDDERQVLEAALGNPTLTPDEVAVAQQLIEQSGARQKVEQMIEDRLQQAGAVLAELDLATDGAEFLRGLIDYLRGRKR